MRNTFVFAVAVLLFAVSLNFSQIVEKPKVDPFKLEKGSLFSTSKRQPPPQESGIAEPFDVQRDKIVVDFIEALDLIKANYVDSKRVNYNQLTKTSISTMLRTLDPHSNYFDAAEYQELLDDQHSEYIGVGCSIANYVKNGVTDTYIISTYPDSPALKAGLRFGDRVISVNGENVSGKTSFDVREKIRGPKGTSVRLTIERASNSKIETLEIRRASVPQPSIPDGYLLRQNIGYIDFSNGFNYTTSDELEIALKDLQEQGMTSLILDMRDNPGGIVEQAVRVAEKFLQPGQVVVTQKGRFEIDNRTWKAINKNPELMPLVILVDEGSASATEIVAGALQDHDRALIVGEKTFGKGLVQSVIDLPNNSGLTLTTAKYFTPSGRSIQRDYSNIGTYDYFQHKVKTTQNKESKTNLGRIVYSGDGITPDELVKNPQLSQVEVSLLDPMFFFSREIIAGKVAELEGYKNLLPIKFGKRLRPSDFPDSEILFKSFKEYLLKSKTLNLSNEQIESNKRFILNRLRYNLATATFGNVAANQVLIENDTQVAKAIEVLPRAQNLALSARKIMNKK